MKIFFLNKSIQQPETKHTGLTDHVAEDVKQNAESDLEANNKKT
jgi:hypothetical protein